MKRSPVLAAAPRWAAAVRLPFVLCVAVARPLGLPPGSTLIAHVDAIGHVWHYWDAADAVEHGEPLFQSTRIYFPMGGNHLLHRGGHLPSQIVDDLLHRAFARWVIPAGHIGLDRNLVSYALWKAYHCLQSIFHLP